MLFSSFAAFFCTFGASAAPASLSPGDLAVEERVAAGGAPGDFMTVRYLKLSGGQRAIGRKLAEIARERHGFAPQASDDRPRTRAIRRYFEKNDPLQLERMGGAAEFFGVRLDEDRVSLDSLAFGFARPGCTVVYYPPSWTATGTGIFCRNYDFTTGTLMGQIPGPGEVPCTSTPYVLELHPDRGFATLALVAYDLFGVIDGMNSEGLTVALLADDEQMAAGRTYPANGPQPGFGVLQIQRHLLETCADVEEARAALLDAKLYYDVIPCHYVIADRHGRSFVWENSASLAQGFCIDGHGEPQVSTNYMQHLHPDPADLPEERDPQGSFNRCRTVLERAAQRKGEIDESYARETSGCVAFELPVPGAPRAPNRTLWRALYIPEERRLAVDFYLGESSAKGKPAIRRSEILSFELEPAAELSRR